MINLIHADFYKLRKTLAFKVCLLITIGCAAILTFLSHGMATGTLEVQSSVASGLSDAFMVSVIGSLFAGILICNDFDSKNIHDEISCGRGSIVVSKTVIYTIVIILFVLPYAIAGFVAFVSKGSFTMDYNFSTYTAVMANSTGMAVDGNAIFKVIRLLLVSVILHAAKLSICIPLAFKVRKSVIVTVIGVVFFCVIDSIINVLVDVPVVGEILKFTPFSYNLLPMTISEGELLKICLVSTGFIIIMAFVTYRLFRKAEIK